MIELVVAALIQIATITTDASATSQDAVNAQSTTQTEQTDGGTGSWDDNGVYAN